MADAVDEVLGRLARDVEAAVHALYRGDTRQATAKARTGHVLRAAADSIRAIAAGGDAAARPAGADATGRGPQPTPAASTGWTREEGEAVMKCVTAWQPMGPPANLPPDSRCIAAGREMVPTWSERELARLALRRIAAV